MRSAECGMRNNSPGPRAGGSPDARRLPGDSAFRIPHSALVEITAFAQFLEKERNDSPHTVKAYGRDLADFAAFCGRYYGGAWSWAGVDRLPIRAWLGSHQQRGLAKSSSAPPPSALRTFYSFLNATRGVDVKPANSG